ncbi:MAG: hypothetical protein A2X29_02065 [Elusimicrobia bacterium GWA2_64_40]|nr:MAG: hypothetical protein A2X29_02065 [Elusimicrobia bacterium GWA2_64_40]OGR62005.1 MAG: hypothetical protein A2X30_01055 [Elusimicrobia bacterium GWB2_63_16]HAN03907.1 hypothetical protein [Elusimicrobiota bacterium]
MKRSYNMKTIFAIFSLLCLAALAAAPARAAFEDVETGPRASAMAGAYAAQSEGISSVFYNPAGIIGTTRYEAALAQQKLYLGLTDGSAISRNAIAFGLPLAFGGSYWGTAAVGLDTLSLDSLYSESRLRIAWAYPLKERLWAGLAIARMGVTYGSDAYTAVNPVLSSAKEMSAMGLDLGAVYSAELADFGLSIQNANEPDLGIKYANKVSRKISLGMALKRQAFTWNTDLSLSGQDIKIKTGAEVPVMKETYGDRLQARGGFSVGSRDYRSLAAGFGYRRASYRVDYSFVYPLSGLADTMGSHQLGLFVAWGEARGPLADRENQYSDEAGEKGRGGGKGDGAGEGEGLPQKTEPSKQDLQKAGKLLREARLSLRSGAYAKAEAAYKKADELLMNTDPSIKETTLKMNAVSEILPEATAQAGRDDLLRKSVNRYADKNTDAVLYITYARQKWPRDIAVARLYNLISREFPETASELRILPGITIIDQLLQDALDFIRNGRFIQAISTLQRVLQLEPDNIPALTRMGSAYWAMEKKDIARKNWRRVLELDPGNTEVNQFMKMN